MRDIDVLYPFIYEVDEEGELVEKVDQGSDNIQDSLGIAYLRDGKLQKNARRPVLRDLDSLPDPAWDLVDLKAYKDIWKASQGYFSLNIATTRGCPFKCNWCAKPIYGNRYNSRSPQRVAKEMAHAIQALGAEHFWVCDDIFGLKPGWVQSFRDEVKRLGIRPRYGHSRRYRNYWRDQEDRQCNR